MTSKQNFGDAIRIAFELLKHCKLIGVDRLIFVDTGLNVPASKIAAKGSRKSSGAKSADGRALPKAVVNMAAFERRFLCARIFERFSDRALPGDFGNFIIRARNRQEKSNGHKQKENSSTKDHKNLRT